MSDDSRSTDPAKLTDAHLAEALRLYARDIESEGRTYAPRFMREAAKRLARAPARAERPAVLGFGDEQADSEHEGA